MNKKWKYKGIGEICHLMNGRAFKPSDWSPDGLKIIRIQNLNDNTKQYNCFNGEVSDKHLVNDGTVLLSWSGTPGTSFGCFIWNQGEAVLNQHIFKVLIKKDFMTDEFFTYAVNSQLDEMIRQAHGGVGLRHITKKKLEAMQIPVPPLSEQHRLVAHIKECMKRVDEILTLRENTKAEMEIYISAIIEDILTDCVGEKAKLSEVAEIVGKLVDPKEEEYQNLFHVGGSNIVSKTGILINLKTAEEEGLISGKHIFSEDDCLYSKIRPYLQKVAKPGFTGLCSADIYPIRPKKDVILRDFLFFLFLSRNFTNYANSVSNRAGIPKINRQQLFSYEFILPTTKNQTEIVKTLNSAFSFGNKLNSEINSMDLEIAKIKSSILQRAFSGEL